MHACKCTCGRRIAHEVDETRHGAHTCRHACVGACVQMCTVCFGVHAGMHVCVCVEPTTPLSHKLHISCARVDVRSCMPVWTQCLRACRCSRPSCLVLYLCCHRAVFMHAPSFVHLCMSLCVCMHGCMHAWIHACMHSWVPHES